MIRVLRRLSGLSIVYALGDVVTKGASFILLPVYSRFLTPEDFGVLAVWGMVGSVTAVLMSLGFTSAILRFYHQFPDEMERKRFYGAMWTCLVAFSGAVLCLFLRIGPLMCTAFLRVPHEPFLQLTLWTMFLNAAFNLLPATLFRAGERASGYVLLNLFSFTLSTCATIWLVVLRGQGAVGYAYAQLISSAGTAAIGAAVLLRVTIPNACWRQLRPALAYGLPLVPHELSHWALGVSDRAILERYVPLGQLGLYSVGYQFGTAYQLVLTSVNNALMPTFSRAAREEATLRILPQVATYYALAAVGLALAVALLAGDVIALVMPPQYGGARAIVPWVVLGYLAMALYYLPMNNLSMTAGKVRSVPLLTLLAASANIGLNLWAVPRVGIAAAAVNTAVGYALLGALVLLVSQRVHRLDYEYGRLGKLVGCALALYALGRLSMRYSASVNVCLGVLVILLLPLALACTGFWTAQEQRYLIGAVRRQFSR